MCHYHQLLNQLEGLRLTRIHALLPGYLDTHINVSLVKALHELLREEITFRSQQAHERRLKRANLTPK
ncbi:hypothetical protein [Lactococcus garvieae]|uniref:hypothetical protein n=1 Tax=Lactococcus garvieae TaxID=1363 RepID=UPI0038533E83